ncbi:ATP-binding domain-containing protein [Quadrisphaera sp. KR29]|uniref:ATP-binding domain-containing protein n=1 Tax=Quadrisphaera sp. KR29 TaxID=3461391 RepID=UPI004043ADA0
MPRCLPEDPSFATSTEKIVWQKLRDTLGEEDLLVANQRVTTHEKDHELDVVVGLAGHGVVVLEVKGGEVWHDGFDWHQRAAGSEKVIHPAAQARDGMYALRALIEGSAEWRGTSKQRFKWGHAVVLPTTSLAAGFSAPDLPRWAVADRNQLDGLVPFLKDLLAQQGTGNRQAQRADLDLLAEELAGRNLPQRDVVAQALEHEAQVDVLTSTQLALLRAARLLPRLEVRGGAGSGTTFMALEQARRLGQDGQRVALLCYSLGLASYLQRATGAWKNHKHRPQYVGVFHDLGAKWSGQPHKGREDAAYWEHELPARMTELAHALPPGQRFDAIVVDEAQDFAPAWWEPLVASLSDPDTGGLYVFSDEGQTLFPRYSRPELGLVPLVLDDNLRNSKQIATAFSPLVGSRMQLRGGDGPQVEFRACSPDDAVGEADDAVDDLLDAGWRPQDVALITTGSRHPEQVSRWEDGPAAYWRSFWDDALVFYGHVFGFKGLERRAVVLALNEKGTRDRARERLYVGLSRAREQLVVCGDPDFVRWVGGDDVAKRLGL